MQYVKPKKHLGQHFLTNQSIAKRIVDSLINKDNLPILEIGPGTGVLTQHYTQTEHFKAAEVDTESIAYLNETFPSLEGKILNEDFLKMDLDATFDGKMTVIGNFPYNISSQIYFKALHNRNKVVEVVGMIQKEVAERICSKHGTKVYGILSVLLQAFYDTEYLFTVHENEFNPPPKVKSGVLRLTRNNVVDLGCDEALFIRVVKAAFNLRRKTLRNSLKLICNEFGVDTSPEIFNLRPEQISVQDFIDLTTLIGK